MNKPKCLNHCGHDLWFMVDGKCRARKDIGNVSSGNCSHVCTFAQPEPLTTAELDEFIELLDRKVGVGRAWLMHEDEINRAARNLAPRLVERVKADAELIAELKEALETAPRGANLPDGWESWDDQVEAALAKVEDGGK